MLLPTRVRCRYCPWKEAPDGGPLPPIERVLVDEHLVSCRNCNGGALEAERRNSEALCPRCFFNVFVRKRKPCLLRLVSGEATRGDPQRAPCEAANRERESSPLADCRALLRWSDLTYLTQIAGGEIIDVEIRGLQGASSFGGPS